MGSPGAGSSHPRLWEANKEESPWPKILQKTKSSKHRLFGKRKNIFEICLSVDLKLRVSKTQLIFGLNNPQVPHLLSHFIGGPCHSWLHLRVHLVGIAEVFLCSSSLVVSLCLRNLAWKKERMGIGKVSQEVSLEVVSSLKTDSLQLKIGQGPKGNFIIQRFLRGEMLVLGRVTYLFAYYERSMIHHASYFRFLDRKNNKNTLSHDYFGLPKKKAGVLFFFLHEFIFLVGLCWSFLCFWRWLFFSSITPLKFNRF